MHAITFLLLQENLFFYVWAALFRILILGNLIFSFVILRKKILLLLLTVTQDVKT